MAIQTRINHILASLPVVLYSFEAKGENNPTFISDNVREVLGYEPSEYLEDRNFIPSRIHPEDTIGLEKGFSGLFKDGHLINEYRFHHKDGSYLWVHDELRVIYNEIGEPLEIVGSLSDITARKEAEAAIGAAHARINHILSSSPAVLYSFEAKGNYTPTFISNNVREVFGYEPSEYLENRNFVPDRIHPDDAVRVNENLSLLFENGHLINEYRFRHKDGSYCWVHDELRIIYDKQGNPVEAVGSWSDISLRKKAEADVTAAHARLNYILTSSPAVLYCFDPIKRTPTFISENIRVLFGYESHEYLEDRNFVPDRIHPDDAVQALGNLMKLFDKEYLFNEYRFRCSDGSYRWVSDELRVIYDDKGKPLEAVGSWSDSTARKEAEEAVTAAYARLNHILASSPAVLYSFEATGENNPTFISDNVRKVFGYEPNEYMEDRNFVPDRIHPDDVARVKVDLSNLFEKGYLINEYRFRHKDGDYRWVHDELRIIKGDDGNPAEIVGSWSDITARKQVNENIISLLKATSLFGTLDDSTLGDLAAEANPVQLMGGMQLIQQGDLADSFYLVIGGRIRTFVTMDDENERPTGEVGKGELVGETAILTGETQLESARAIRDTNLLQFSRETFSRLVEHHPETVLLLSKNIALRYQREVRGINANTVISTIAVIPAGHGASITDFTRRLAASLAYYGSTLHLDVSTLEQVFGQGNVGGSKEEHLSQWLHERETLFQFVIYESTLEPSPWSHRCIRQADRILFVGTAGSDPALNLIEREITSRQNKQSIARQELVLLHPNRDRLPSGTGKWLDIRNLVNHHQMIADNTEDFKRLCRFLTGNAISLVLGGGGARGCAHIGLIRAMQELDIPIDAIGGTSIGSIVASAFALGCTTDEMLVKIDTISRESKPIKDLTFPMISLMSGVKLNKSLEKMYGDVQIEDLWVNYYSVSANLTRAQTEVHKRGPVWKSVRASMSIPGQIPPVVFNGELHVDGGILNNLPVDVMRKVCDGIVIANNVSPSVEMNVAGTSEATYSGWYYMLNALNPFSKKVEFPSILKTLMRSGMLSSIQSINVTKAMADIYMSPPIENFQLLDFGLSHEIEDVGYKYALKTMNEQLHDNELFKSILI